MTFSPEADRSADETRQRFELGIKPSARALIEVANRLGASVAHLPGSALQGSLAPAPDCLPGSWQIAVDRTMPSYRFRFAVAHELGHLYLRHHDLKPRSEERWCNQFAAELLMPAKAIATDYRDADPSFDALIDVARRFDVSRSAALVRLRHVQRWPRALISLRLRDDRWLVARMTAVPAVALYQLEPEATGTDIPRSSGVFHSWLRFGFHHELIEILSEGQRRGTWLDLLVNSSDLEDLCTQIVRAADPVR